MSSEQRKSASKQAHKTHKPRKRIDHPLSQKQVIDSINRLSRLLKQQHELLLQIHDNVDRFGGKCGR